MSVPTSTSRSTATGNGATVNFNTGFYFLDQSQVVVRLTPSGGVEVVQTLGVHYTVTMPAGVGLNGAITMLTAPPVASALVIERTVPYTQVTSLRSQGSFAPEIHEDAFDERCFVEQQLARRVSDLESAGAPGSVIAGNGLSFIATTLHVGAGAGIQANADTIEVLYGDETAMIPSVSDAGLADGGATNQTARVDHTHVVSTAIAGAIAVGDAASRGAATTLARSDHTHALAAPAVPANVTKAAASAGVATTVARADHKHDVSTAAAVTLTDAANAEGAATTLARSDHTHSHGARGGGALHANAVSGGAAGFLTGADKALMDAMNAVKTHVFAQRTAAQTFASGAADATVVFDGERFDTKNEFDITTGIFTAVLAGYYLITTAVRLVGSAVAAAGDTCTLKIVTTPFSVSFNGVWEQGVDSSAMRMHGALGVFLAAGETVKIQIAHLHSGGLTRDTSGGTSATHVTINRID